MPYVAIFRRTEVTLQTIPAVHLFRMQIMSQILSGVAKPTEPSSDVGKLTQSADVPQVSATHGGDDDNSRHGDSAGEPMFLSVRINADDQEWTRRLQRRHKSLVTIQQEPIYQKPRKDGLSQPVPPWPHARWMSKRDWEKRMMAYRKALHETAA